MRILLILSLVFSFSAALAEEIVTMESEPLLTSEAESEPQKLCANVGLNEEARAQCIALDNYPQDVCTQVHAAAKRHGLDVGFFARLIWKESLFDNNARSHMGAEGIAQFIPSTARLRGLKNAYNPVEALDKSAAYLVELKQRFGSYGMAAVAYNAGEGRASAYRQSGGFMPYETQDYVMTITGQSVETWRLRPAIEVDYALVRGKEFMPSCLDLVARKPITRFANKLTAEWMPFGVELGAHAKQNVAERIFNRVKAQHAALIGQEKPIIVPVRNKAFGNKSRYAVRVGRKSRAEAVTLCQSIRAGGGVCTIQKNPR